MMPISDPRDRFFCPVYTPMKDPFSCKPFGLPYLIFKTEPDKN